MRLGDGEEGRALADDQDLVAFFERHHVELTRWAYVLVGYAPVAEDVVMETFEAVLRQWPAVSTARSPLAYTRRILVRKASLHWRTREREVGYGLTTEPAGSRPAWEDALVDRLVALPLLAALPERKRLCVLLRLGFGLSVAETADVLGVSEGTVKSQTAKGLALLRDHAGVRDAEAAR